MKVTEKSAEFSPKRERRIVAGGEAFLHVGKGARGHGGIPGRGAEPFRSSAVKEMKTVGAGFARTVNVASASGSESAIGVHYRTVPIL